MTVGRLVVVDTNVVVSGLISSGRGSPSARILDEMLQGRLRYVLSVPLLTEYRAVLLRPRIRRFHGRSEAEVDRILTRLVENGAVREPNPTTTRAPDPGDGHLWELLEAGDSSGARDLFNQILPLINLERLLGVAIYKEVMRRRGVIATNAVRGPIGQLDRYDIAALDAILERVEPLFTI